MKALIIIDAQNEFTAKGQRPVANMDTALVAIKKLVTKARAKGYPIVWIRHFNKPGESAAFVPNTWGSQFILGLGPVEGDPNEVEMHKNVYGAFTGTDIANWLENAGIRDILIIGFYTHGCLSTTSREAIMLNLNVSLAPDATGSRAMQHPLLGKLTADESHRAALLQLVDMGAELLPPGYVE